MLFVILIADIFFITIFTFISWTTVKSLKREIALLSTEKIEADVLKGLERSAILNLAKGTKRYFWSIEYISNEGTLLFELPPNGMISSDRPLFSGEISIPIASDFNMDHGKVIFHYSLTVFIQFVLLGFCLILSLSYFIFSFWKKRIISEFESQLQLRNAQTLNELTQQVAHDIRSPLSAMNMMMGRLSLLPEGERLLIRSAVHRINDIANDLLSKSTEDGADNINPVDNGNGPVAIHLLGPLVDALISEKRTQYRERQNIEITADLSFGYGAFVEVNIIEMGRVISNLINNSIEALHEKSGTVSISICCHGGKVSLSITDNGGGIPKEIMDRLGEKGVTFGKNGTESGSGLGIYHAKKVIEKYYGQFKVETELGVGTCISLLLPTAKAPDWFLEKLVLRPSDRVITVDDDVSMHQVWRRRFAEYHKEDSIIMSFTSIVDFKSWVLQNLHADQIFLIDYEFLNQKTNGLDLIEMLGIQSRSILVTSWYEEEQIRQNCQNLDVKLIPKPMAGFVPIEITSTFS